MREILAILGDAGNTNYFLAAYQELKQRYRVVILADPKGAGTDTLKKYDVEHTVWDGDDVIPGGISMVLCGTAGKAQNLWRAATLAAREARIPCLWFGDFFNSGCEAKMLDVNPDHFCGIDWSTVNAFKDCRPQFQGQATAVGNPDFDQLHAYDMKALRKKARHMIGVPNNERLVVYSASSLKQLNPDEPFDILVNFVKKHDARFSIRFHPADLKDTEFAASKITPLLGRYQRELEDLFVDTSKLNETEAIGAADVFLTDFSTGGIKACVMGIATGFIMLKSVQTYQANRGGEFPFFPILDRDLGRPPAIGVFDKSEANLLDELLTPGYTERANIALWEEFPSFDKGAAERFVSFVDSVARN